MKIVVCGLGKLGSSIAVSFAMRGFDVVGLDLDAVKVGDINAGRAPVQEQGLGELTSRAVTAKCLRATTNVAEAVPGSGACIFVTSTPSLPDGSFDNGPLLKAIESVAKICAIDNTSTPYLFVIASTVTPGTCEGKILPLLTSIVTRPYHLVYKPEFIALGTVIRDLQFPDLHLIGQSTEAAGALAVELYGVSSNRANVPYYQMSLIEAELAKISLNCFVTMKISFANQVGLIADQFGADPHKILDAIAADRRIGRAALKPGLPYGGPCFPRDSRMFVHVADQACVRAHLAEATDRINRAVVESIVHQVLDHDGSKYSDIGILGTAYKPGTSNTDESPASMISNLLQGRIIKTHDPMAKHSHSLEEVLACSILIVATAWPEYTSLKYAKDTLLIDPMYVVKMREVILHRRAVSR